MYEVSVIHIRGFGVQRSTAKITEYDLAEFRGDVKISLPLTTNFLQNVTESSKVISYPVCDLCRRFTTDGTNGLL